MSTSDDTLSLPARLFQLHARLSSIAGMLEQIALTTCVQLDAYDDANCPGADYLQEMDPLVRELWQLRNETISLRRDVVRQLGPLQIGLS